jgi:hypothetical protein
MTVGSGCRTRREKKQTITRATTSMTDRTLISRASAVFSARTGVDYGNEPLIGYPSSKMTICSSLRQT